MRNIGCNFNKISWVFLIIFVLIFGLSGCKKNEINPTNNTSGNVSTGSTASITPSINPSTTPSVTASETSTVEPVSTDSKPVEIGLYLAYTTVNGKQLWGYIDRTGKFAIKPQFESAADFTKNGVAVVSKNDKYGIINRSGKFVVKPVYINSFDYQDGHAIACDDITGKTNIYNDKVLIVDDSDFMRMMLNDILTRSEHSVAQAENGSLALKMLDKEQIDVCILDIKMPGMNGLETLEQIKKSHPEVKVIMLSAQCMEENVRRALELHADAFVAKPFQADSIINRV